MRCFFVSDLHGSVDKYRLLSDAISNECPDAVMLGGDLLPGGYGRGMPVEEFLSDVFIPVIERARDGCRNRVEFFVIMGNDDPRIYEGRFRKMEEDGLINYIQQKAVRLDGLFVAGYSCVPPTPFQLKDWEKYDVSRFTDVGCVSPEKGIRTVEVEANNMKFSTIQQDMEGLKELSDPTRTIYVFHSPPFKTPLDRADLEGRLVDHAPVDVHVGSIAIRKFIEAEQPLLTLHGHIHESSRMTGAWKDRIQDTNMFSGAHDGPELALVRFDTDELENATRELMEPQDYSHELIN